MAKAREAHTCRADAQGLAGRHPSTPSHALGPPHTQNRGPLSASQGLLSGGALDLRAGRALSDLTPGASPASCYHHSCRGFCLGGRATGTGRGTSGLPTTTLPLNRPRPRPRFEEGALQPAGGSVTGSQCGSTRGPLLPPGTGKDGWEAARSGRETPPPPAATVSSSSLTRKLLPTCPFLRGCGIPRSHLAVGFAVWSQLWGCRGEKRLGSEDPENWGTPLRPYPWAGPEPRPHRG